jgi:hypothetical protein
METREGMSTAISTGHVADTLAQYAQTLAFCTCSQHHMQSAVRIRVSGHFLSSKPTPQIATLIRVILRLPLARCPMMRALSKALDLRRHR